MNSGINTFINRGVPLNTPVSILHNELLEIVDDSEEFENLFQKQFYNYMKFLNDLVGYDLYIEFLYAMMIYTDDNLEKKIIFSPEQFISSLCLNLGLLNGTDASKSTVLHSVSYNSFREAIEELRNCKNESEFKRKFPFLYNNSYVNGRNVYNNYENIRSVFNNPNIDFRKKLEFTKEINESVKKSTHVDFNIHDDLKKADNFKSFEVYREKVACYFETILNNHHKINEYLVSHPLDFSKLSKKNNSNIDLYLAYRFLESSIFFENDSQRFIYYVSDYFERNKNSNSNYPEIEISIGVFDDVISKNSKKHKNKKNYKRKVKITPKILFERYKEILLENPELSSASFSDIDFSNMTLDEVEEFMDLYSKDLKANWEFFKVNDDNFDRDILSKMKKSGDGLSEEEKQKYYERVTEQFMEKKLFWDSTSPFYRIRGKNTFDGYIGHIYTNGMIILDKFYDNTKNCKVAYGNAIYYMSIKDFYKLSHMSKSELIEYIKNNPEENTVGRILHAGDWQSKTNEVINMNKVGNPADVVEQLTKIKEVVKPE